MANAYAPLKREIADDISLSDAIAEAKLYAAEKGYEKPSSLYWNGERYNFLEGGVFLMDKDNRPKQKVE
jgi:hypothetical protein